MRLFNTDWSHKNQIKRAGDNLAYAFSQNLHSKYNGYNGSFPQNISEWNYRAFYFSIAPF